MKVLMVLVSIAIVSGCGTVSPPCQEIRAIVPASDRSWAIMAAPIISLSAAGWTIKPGPPEPGRNDATTVVVNPQQREFNIGVTPYPDIHPATLWIVEVKEFDARFLLIRVPPSASGAVTMPILYLDNNDIPTLACSIQQRFEFQMHPHDQPGYDPKIEGDGECRLRDILFEDSDGDGVPELVERDVWKESGTVTYYRLTDQKTFLPLWREEWKLGADSFERVSRVGVRKD